MESCIRFFKIINIIGRILINLDIVNYIYRLTEIICLIFTLILFPLIFITAGIIHKITFNGFPYIESEPQTNYHVFFGFGQVTPSYKKLRMDRIPPLMVNQAMYLREITPTHHVLIYQCNVIFLILSNVCIKSDTKRVKLFQ